MCANHFSLCDFERDLKGELLNRLLKHILKKISFPTLKMATRVSQTAHSDPRNTRIKKRENGKTVEIAR